MAKETHTRLLILGSGPAGCTAGIYAARAALKPVILQGLEPGGQMTLTTDVENYPGFEEVIQGPWLMEQMERQAAHVGVQLLQDIVVQADLSKRPFRLVGDSGDRYLADALIIATGARAKWLEIPSEKKFTGFGVSACATCDGAFYRDKHVLVVGGGNTAVEEALYLTKFAKSVRLIHRRDTLRAEKILQERLFKNAKISVLWDAVLEEVLGDTTPHLSVTGAEILHLKTKKKETLKADGIFIAIGHAPQTELFQGALDMKANGVLITKAGTTETNIAGVYAAGDVADDVYRQAVTAAGMGCMAALEAEQFLSQE